MPHAKCDCGRPVCDDCQQRPHKQPHKHAAVINAWADGAVIQFRNSCRGGGVHQQEPQWTDYTDQRNAPCFAEHIEYRVKPVPHKWQKEIDAAKAGKQVEWSTDGGKTFHYWDVKWTPESLALAERGFATAFNNPGYSFRIKPEKVVKTGLMFRDSADNLCCDRLSAIPNAKFTFEDGKLIKAEVL